MKHQKKKNDKINKINNELIYSRDEALRLDNLVLKLNDEISLLKDKLNYMENEFKTLSKKYKTLCHGDFKISNLFVRNPSPNRDGKVYVIDFQWFGYGNGLLDAVYYLYTSLQTEDLSKIPELLDYYYNEICKHGINDYEKDEFLHHADIILVDFVVYVICSKWSTMTPTDIKQYEIKVKDGLHLRSIPHMELLLKHANRLITEWSKRPSQIIKRKQKFISVSDYKRCQPLH